MEEIFTSKPRVSFEFEIEKIIGVSEDGSFQVQWAPAWVSRSHLIGCEHLIEEFLNQSKKDIRSEINILSKGHENERNLMDVHCKSISSDPVMFQGFTNSVDVKVEDTDSGSSESHLDDLSSEISSKNVSIDDFGQQLHQPQFFCAQQESSVLAQAQPEATHKCDVCHEEFSCLDDIKVHMITHAKKNKPVPEQGEVLSCNSNAKFSCDYCQYSCSLKQSLVKHLRTHTGEKPYTCNICRKAFTQKIHLTQHIRIHTGEKPYQCPYCNSRFARSSQLKTHSRTHSDENVSTIQGLNYPHNNIDKKHSY